MRTILGVTDGDDAGACLLEDGRLVAAVNEERLNRLKMSIGFPSLAVQEVLRIAGKSAADVDGVAMAAYAETFRADSLPNKGWFQESSSLARIRNDIASVLAKPLNGFRPAYGVYHFLKRMTMGRRRSAVRGVLADMGVHAPISYHEHHRCHAVAAFCASGFPEALSLSLDGGGDGCSSHVYRCAPQGLELLNKLPSFDSIGNYYAYVTHLCGFRASIHEGKITGLAASGEPIHLDMFRKLLEYSDGQIRNVGGLFYRGALASINDLLPQDWEHKDLAASIQAHLEEVAVAYVRYWLRRSGQRNVCLSGGVFANVLLNQKIAELPECDAVYVFPAMGDGGLAAGSAYSEWLRHAPAGWSPEQTVLSHVYLGSSFSEREMEDALRSAGTPFERHENIEQVVAKHVHDGKVVAHFDGAMEYGPRALGNRTILYRTQDREINTWLNKRLQRTEFMPFAPACLAGHENMLFDWNKAATKSTRYMTITLDCTPWMKKNCPAVVHIDGTARPQIVDPETNPRFHKIIQHYYEQSGVPVVVNTSFNMHEEPIVCTPSDAIRSFLDGRLDHLALGSFLVGESN